MKQHRVSHPASWMVDMSTSPVTQLERFAAQRYGVFTATEAEAHHVSRRMISARLDNGRWQRVLPNVYRVSAVPVSFRQRCLAATLWAGGRLSHVCAGRLWQFEGIVTQALHLTVGRNRGLSHADVIVHRTDDLIDADLATMHRIAVTSPLRTVLDLAATTPAPALEVAIEDALRRQLFTVGQLRWRADARLGTGVAGSARIRRLLDRRLGDTDSGWEVRVARALTDGGLPEPVRQYEVRTMDGPRWVDLAYPGHPPVVIEYDSDRWHTGVARRHRDAARRNALRLAGATVVEVTPDLAGDPRRLVSLVRTALDASWCEFAPKR